MNVRRVGTQYWEKVQPLLAPAVRHSNGRWTDMELYRDIKTGRQQLWVAVDTDIVGACTTQVITYPTRRTLFIQFLGGSGFRHWMQPGIDALIEFAKEQDCDAIECFGRKGFARILGAVDFEETYTVFERDIR